jgi:Glycosyltransferase sugar-binding region containing DXD motif
MSNKIQSLWVGGKLSPMETACIRSFLKHGHEFCLYSYTPVEGVPWGVDVRDANEVVPSFNIQRFQNLANFSDMFRYALLFKEGGWWVDLDVYCLKNFDFPQPYVFSSQLCNWDGAHPERLASCVIKAPAGSPMLSYCLDEIARTDLAHIRWAAIGPELLQSAHERFGLRAYTWSKNVFCPLEHYEAPANIVGAGTDKTVFPAETVAVHLWNEELRRAGVDKFAEHPGSLYDGLVKNA